MLIVGNYDLQLEWARAGSPPGHEDGKADSLDELSEGTDTNGLEGLLVDQEGVDELHIELVADCFTR